MKKVIKTLFVADDGKSFTNEQDCLEYETILKQVYQILEKLPSNDSISFQNGNGFIQHGKNTIDILKKKIVALANEYFNPSEPYTCFNYYLGRIIDDSGMSCLNKLSYKIMCIDSQNREWGQPYYANNPTKGVQVKLN